MQVVLGMPGRTVPPDPALLSGPVLSKLAVAAEDAGWAGVALDEHPIPPEYWRNGGDGHDGVDPIVAFAAMTANTTRIKLFVYAVQAAIRNPFLLAKSVATLDVLSGGRVELGLVTGYLPEEFEALGVSFEGRNELFDECVEVMKLAWTGEPVTYEGSSFRAVDVRALPRPVQEPHPPLWIGGSSRKALRRVVETGGGWIASWNPRGRKISRYSGPLESLDDFKALIGLLREYADEAGRKGPIPIAQWLDFRDGQTIDDLKRQIEELEGIGVGWGIINSKATTVSGALDDIERIASGVFNR